MNPLLRFGQWLLGLLKNFTLRFAIPLLIVISGFAFTFIPAPFGLQRDQILLALLAFLTVDTVIERLDLLRNIEEGVNSIGAKLTLRISADQFFKIRKDFLRMEQIIGDARKEIWVSGVSLDAMVTIIGSFQTKLTEGCNLRFLAVAPNSSALTEHLRAHSVSSDSETADFRSSQISINLKALSKRLAPEKREVEIHTIDRNPPFGFFISDPNSPHSRMIVQLYGFRVEADEAPLFELTKDKDPIWYRFFRKQFELMWASSSEWKDQPK